MTRDQVTAILRAHEAELRAAGIEALDLFGSVARGEERPDSDVDLACRLNQKAGIGLIKFAGLQIMLEELLGTKVDLVTMKVFNGRIAEHASRSRMPVFG